MSIHLSTAPSAQVLHVQIRGKLDKEDYDRFVPAIERLVQQEGPLRILVEMDEFHGWTAGALWEDVKFDARHFNDIEKLAIVGDRKWEEGMATFCKPFTTAKVKYFDRTEIEQAEQWLETSAPSE